MAITIGTAKYKKKQELRDLTGGKYVLTQKDTSSTTEMCGNYSESEAVETNQAVTDRGGNCPVRINPNVNYSGHATGTDDYEYNAKKLRGNACTVADFRPDSPTVPFTVGITGPSYGCPCDAIALHAGGFGSIPSLYSFQWRTGSDGFSWRPVVSTADYYYLTLPCEEGETIWHRRFHRRGAGNDPAL